VDGRPLYRLLQKQKHLKVQLKEWSRGIRNMKKEVEDLRKKCSELQKELEMNRNTLVAMALHDSLDRLEKAIQKEIMVTKQKS